MAKRRKYKSTTFANILWRVVLWPIAPLILIQEGNEGCGECMPFMLFGKFPIHGCQERADWMRAKMNLHYVTE